MEWKSFRSENEKEAVLSKTTPSFSFTHFHLNKRGNVCVRAVERGREREKERERSYLFLRLFQEFFALIFRERLHILF